MKKMIVSSIQKVDEYCDTVGELIEVLKKFPKDSQLYCTSDYRSVSRCAVRVHVEKAFSTSGSLSHTALCLDTIET